VDIPEEATVLDISGRSVLPGLIDMHGHMYAMGSNQFAAYPSLFLAGGVTTVFSPGDLDPEGMTALRDSVKRGEIEFVVTEAHAAGLKVTGHLGGPTTSLRAIELGIDGLEHGLFAVAEITEVPQNGPLADQYCSLAEVDLSSADVESLIDAIVADSVWVTPTIITMTGIHPDFVPPTADALDFLSDSLRSLMENQPPYLDERGADCLDRALELQLEFVHRVHERGGLVATGTDPVHPLLMPGYALHSEMALLVEAGFTPLEAIAAATRNEAVALGLDGEIGIVREGLRADLTAVRGDPAADITAIGNTTMVFKDGIQYDPQELREAVKGKIGTPSGDEL